MQTCTLNGTWQLSAGHRSLESVDMQIPGTVLSGLLAAGKIKDPFYRTNEDATRALFWKDYVFTRTFDVDEELLAQQHIVLVCEGLDTLAEISINGTFLAKTDNMHRTWKFQAKKLLHPGKNEIQIVFRSVLRFIEDYPYEAHKKINYIPCGSMKGNQLLRKAHSMFGWDWGPQTIDAGIFRDIYLQGYSHARIEDIRIHQQHAKNVSAQTSILKIGNEISQEKYDEILENVIYEKAKNTAVKFLGYRARSKKELRDKLIKDYDENITDKVISMLEKYGYVNDEEYAKAYVRDCLNLKGWGQKRISLELTKRGIDKSIIENSLPKENTEQLELIEKLLTKRLKGNINIDFKEKKKHFDYLARRGFLPSDILEVFFLFLKVNIYISF